MNGNRINTLLLTVIGVATLLVAVIGATFAYFTANLTGGEESTTITVGAGKLSIAYASGDGILTAEKIQPELTDPAITKNFTISGSNTTTSVMPYSLELVIQSNDFTNNALSYTFESTNTGGNGVVAVAISETQMQTGPGIIALGSGYFSGTVSNSVHTYVLKIYFRETGKNQDIDKEKSFAGFVNTKVGEVYTTSQS